MEEAYQGHGFSEIAAHLHADNCTGQNNNNYGEVHLAISAVEDYGRHAQVNHTLLPTRWPYQIRTRLVFWPIQAALQANKGGVH